MRRCITLTVRKRVTGTPEIRLFTMNAGQAEAFARAVARTEGHVDVVSPKVERAIASLLAGAQPKETDAPEIVKLAGVFRPLTTVQVEALPRAGCPEGWIESLIMAVHRSRGRGGRRDVRVVTIRYDMDRDQQVAFNDAVTAIQAMFEVCRDTAWLKAMQLVQRLLGGAQATLQGKEGPGRDLVAPLSVAFPPTTLDDLLLRPLADEQDVMRWSFTRAPS